MNHVPAVPLAVYCYKLSLVHSKGRIPPPVPASGVAVLSLSKI